MYPDNDKIFFKKFFFSIKKKVLAIKIDKTNGRKVILHDIAKAHMAESFINLFLFKDLTKYTIRSSAIPN